MSLASFRHPARTGLARDIMARVRATKPLTEEEIAATGLSSPVVRTNQFGFHIVEDDLRPDPMGPVRDTREEWGEPYFSGWAMRHLQQSSYMQKLREDAFSFQREMMQRIMPPPRPVAPAPTMQWSPSTPWGDTRVMRDADAHVLQTLARYHVNETHVIPLELSPVTPQSPGDIVEQLPADRMSDEQVKWAVDLLTHNTVERARAALASDDVRTIMATTNVPEFSGYPARRAEFERLAQDRIRRTLIDQALTADIANHTASKANPAASKPVKPTRLTVPAYGTEQERAFSFED